MGTYIPPIKLDRSAAQCNYPYLHIEQVRGSRGSYTVKVYSEENRTTPLYDFIVEDALDVQSIVIKLAQCMAEDPLFGLGRNLLPYRWVCNKWQPVSQWFENIGLALYAFMRAPGTRTSPESFPGLVNTAWRTNPKNDPDGLNLRALGAGNGIPLLDAVLVPKFAQDNLVPYLYDYEGNLVENPSFQSWVVRDHSPEDLNLHVINLTLQQVQDALMTYDHGPFEDSELMKFLNSSLKPDGVIAFQDWLGYHLVLSQTKNNEKMLYLYGTGANGKSQLLELIRGVVGREACAEVRLSDLKIQANLEKLIGKVAMLGGEADTETELNTLKMLVSREPISVNPKYRDPYTLVPECLITQASNTKPEFNTKDDAMSRRVVQLPMENSFITKDDGVIVNVAKQILEAEYDLLVAFALKGALSCVAKDGYHPPTSVIEASKAVVTAGNPLYEFRETMEVGSQYEITPGELFEAYRIWCRQKNCRPLSSHHFQSDIERVLLKTGVLLESYQGGGNTYPPSKIHDDGEEVELYTPWINSTEEKIRKRRFHILKGFRIMAGTLDDNPIGIKRTPRQKKLKPNVPEAAIPAAEPPTEELPVF